MPHVERALEKIRRRKALEVGPESKDSDRVREQVEARHAGSLSTPTERDGIEVVARPDLFECAQEVTLDPEILSSHRIRGMSTAEAGEAAYKMLRTRVLQRMRSHHWHNLIITSPRASAGKTLTSINLAISLAHEPNQQVILVDLDLRNPKVGKYLGFGDSYGLTDHLRGSAPIEDIMFRPTNMRRLYVIPGGERLEHSSELLASRQMKVLARTLSTTSNSTIVIFDMPPILEADDMLTFVPQCDAVLFVVAQGETKKRDLDRSKQLLEEVNLLGMVLNKSGDDAPSDYY